MRKRTKILFTVIVCVLVIAAIVSGVLVLNEQKKREAEIQEAQKREREYQNTFQAVSVLNEKSYFYGLEILGTPPKDYDENSSNVLPTTETDNYHCQYYCDTFVITSIAIWSDDAHVFGIHVGDNLQEAVSILETEGYMWNQPPVSTAEDEGRSFRYTKNDIAINVRVSEKDKNIIEALGVFVYDSHKDR